MNQNSKQCRVVEKLAVYLHVRNFELWGLPYPHPFTDQEEILHARWHLSCVTTVQPETAHLMEFGNSKGSHTSPLHKSAWNLACDNESTVCSFTSNFTRIGTSRHTYKTLRPETPKCARFWNIWGLPYPPSTDRGEIWHTAVNLWYALPRQTLLCLACSIRSEKLRYMFFHAKLYFYDDVSSPAVKPPILGDACIRVRIKYFLQFHDLWTLLNKIREGVALSPLSILHKTHWYAN